VHRTYQQGEKMRAGIIEIDKSGDYERRQRLSEKPNSGLKDFSLSSMQGIQEKGIF
jgi:hypothetical protein